MAKAIALPTPPVAFAAVELANMLIVVSTHDVCVRVRVHARANLCVNNTERVLCKRTSYYLCNTAC